MGDFEEAFKLKAQELLTILKTNNLPAEALGEVRGLFEQAQKLYKGGEGQEALVTVVKAIQRAKKG